MIAFSVLVVGGYSALAFTQRELGEPERDEIPASVRVVARRLPLVSLLAHRLPRREVMKLDNMGDAVVSSAVFAGIGLVVFAIAFWIMTKIAPFSVKKEIEEDQNVALAVIMAGVIIGISLIISAAITGTSS